MANCVILTKGRRLPCKSGSGGLRAVSFAPWSEETVMSGSTGEVSSIPSGITNVFRYELKNAGNTYTETIAADAEVRSTFYNGELALVLQKLDLETKNEVKMLAMGELLIFLEDYNGHVYVIGNGNGAQISGGSFVTGGARADMNGTNLTFSTMENEPFLHLSDAAIEEYKSKWVQGI